MTKEELRERFKQFALRVLSLSDALPKNTKGFVIGKQIIRSGTSSAANYRAALRGRSTEEFVSKLCIVEEELDETMFWLELIMEGGLIKKELLLPFFNESNELLSIIIATKKKVKQKKFENSETLKSDDQLGAE
jgi:four helix bundle protein